MRAGTETFKSFMSLLSLFLGHYLESRKVDSLESLIELLLCDRVKASLSEAALNHVLRCEASLPDSWTRCEQLSDILDVYYASYDQHDRLNVSTICGNVANSRSNQSATQRTQFSQRNFASQQPFSRSFAPSTTTAAMAQSAGRKADIADKRCFNCGSNQHLRKDCKLGKPPAVPPESAR
jgi:hypothetical protein